MKNKMCYNCKHATSQFKVIGKSHVHCQNENIYPSKGFIDGNLTAWDSLRAWHNSCEKHKLK